MTDQWANWRKRLAGEKIHTYENEPDPGYYRKPLKNKGETKISGWMPVAYFRDDGGTIRCVIGALDGRRSVDLDTMNDLWLWVVKHPVTEAAYRAVAERGEPWHDAPLDGPKPPRKAVIGDNNPPPDEPEKPVDPLAELREQIANAIGAAKDFKIASDEDAMRAQGSRSRLLELSGTADKRRTAEKEPHLKAGREVDDKYRELVQAPKDAADTLRKALSAFETKKRNDAAAAAAAAEAERRRLEDERLRLEELHAKAEKLAKRRGEEPPAPLPPPEPVHVAPVQTPAPAAKITGGYGRAASVQTVKIAVIEDPVKAVMHYVNHADVRALALKLATADVRAGLSVPGVRVEEEADVR